MKRNFWNFLFAFVCVLFLIILFINDINHALEFDSSFNLNVIKNIASHGIYGTSVYLVDGQKYYWFDPWITTGPTVFLPTALLIKIVSDFIFIPRLVMNVFFITFLYILAKLIVVIQRKIHFTQTFIYVTSLVFIFSKFISNVTILGVDLVGEIPAYLFILLSIWGLFLESPFIAGLSIGLAVATKLQLVYFCIPLFLGYSYFFYKKRGKDFFKFVLAAAMPVTIFTVSLLLVYGRHIKSYYGDFKGVAIMQKAYPILAGDAASAGVRFIRFIRYDPAFLIMLTVWFAIVFFQWRKYDLKRKIVFGSFSLYLGYFLFLWQFIAHRHLVIPTFIAFLLPGIVTMTYMSTDNMKKFIVGTFIVSILLFPSLIESGEAFRNQTAAADHLRNKYGNATIYNIGWWKSPELQILLNKDFIRLDKKNRKMCSNDCKLIIADYILKGDPTVIPILDKYQKIDSFNGYSLYDLEKPRIYVQ